MSTFRTANSFTTNNVQGFCVQLPPWTRTIRSSLKGWRYDMRWELSKKTEAMELVVWLMEDNQNRASYETGMELWRFVLPEARPGCDVQQLHRQLETEAEFKTAHLEWVLGQALHVTLQPEVLKAIEETQRDLKRALAENKNFFSEISKLNEANVAMNDSLTQATKEHKGLRQVNAALHLGNEAQRNALALAEHALTLRGSTKVKTEAKVKALEALKELHEVVQVPVQELIEPEPYHTGCMGDPEEPYVVRKCWFETTPTGNLFYLTAELVSAASGLTIEAALKTVHGNHPFAVLPDRWPAFDTGLKKLGVEVCMASTEQPLRYECWFTEQVTKEKIRTIKAVREFSGLGLKEAKDATECNGHFFIPTRCWAGWQEEIAKLTETRWTYKFASAVTCEW